MSCRVLSCGGRSSVSAGMGRNKGREGAGWSDWEVGDRGGISHVYLDEECCGDGV